MRTPVPRCSLCDPDVMLKVMHYIADPETPLEPEDDIPPSTRLRRKYAYVCSELVCSDVANIYEVICSSEELLDIAFSFIVPPRPIPATTVASSAPLPEHAAAEALPEVPGAKPEEVPKPTAEVETSAPVPVPAPQTPTDTPAPTSAQPQAAADVPAAVVVPVSTASKPESDSQTASTPESATRKVPLYALCSKVGQYLLSKKVQQVVEHMQRQPDFVSALLSKIMLPGVLDVLVKLIQCAETPQGCGILEWLCNAGFVTQLVDLFSPEQSAEVHEGAAQTLVEVIATSFMSAGTPGATLLLDTLQQSAIFSTLLSHLLATESALMHGFSALTLLFNLQGKYDYDMTPVEELPESFATALAIMPQLHALLSLDEKEYNISPNFCHCLRTLDTPYNGNLLPPLGQHRLRVVEFVLSLVRTNYACLLDYFAESPLLPRVLELFFHYHWNTLLHQAVQETLLFLFASPHIEIKMHVLEKGQLLRRILDTEVASAREAAETGLSRGNIATITKVATSVNFIATPSEFNTPDPAIAKFVSETQGWAEYTGGLLSRRQATEAPLLGGQRPGVLTQEELERIQNAEAAATAAALGYSLDAGTDITDGSGDITGLGTGTDYLLPQDGVEAGTEGYYDSNFDGQTAGGEQQQVYYGEQEGADDYAPQDEDVTYTEEPVVADQSPQQPPEPEFSPSVRRHPPPPPVKPRQDEPQEEQLQEEPHEEQPQTEAQQSQPQMAVDGAEPMTTDTTVPATAEAAVSQAQPQAPATGRSEVVPQSQATEEPQQTQAPAQEASPQQ
eukprot:TRINITY_DN2899_c0_g1_i1.p1 TRINITY_DN2899_c0_g1~~TRINITY_DN2899_c0_g1_i1.p1  ORF type:complete len:789 (-),score=240.65 TRINITY_DN2899_c0_g1_i1:66-2432(-)